MECEGSHFSTGGHFSPPGLGVMTHFLQTKNDPFGRRKWTPGHFSTTKNDRGSIFDGSRYSSLHRQIIQTQTCYLLIIHKYHMFVVCHSTKGSGLNQQGFWKFSGLLFNKIYVGGNHILPVQMTVCLSKPFGFPNVFWHAWRIIIVHVFYFDTQ